MVKQGSTNCAEAIKRIDRLTQIFKAGHDLVVEDMRKMKAVMGPSDEFYFYEISAQGYVEHGYVVIDKKGAILSRHVVDSSPTGSGVFRTKENQSN